MIHGTLHAVFPIGDASRVGEARRHAQTLARAAGFGEVPAGRLALVVTELATNLLKHAKQGRLLIAGRIQPPAVEVLSIDEGPGIGDLDQCMGDGFSTGGSPGTGLGAVRRLADDFDIYSSVPAGTLIVARVRAVKAVDTVPEAKFRVGAVAIAAPGEVVSGDAWALAIDDAQVAVIMADGLGHGPDAAIAAQAAMRVFERNPFAEPRSTLESAHVALHGTRGAAVCTALADAASGSIRLAGAGNVAMRVLSGISDRTLLSQHGTVGLQMRRTEEVRGEWPAHASMVIHSDGIQKRWLAAVIVPVLARDPVLAACLLVRDFCRGRDDVSIVILRRKE
ncbi:MAG: anti-sigma regulatory factor [Burkholderiaceae bacterium]